MPPSGTASVLQSWDGYRVGQNPAAWTDNLEHEFALPKSCNHPALPCAKVAGFLESLRAMHHARRDTYCQEFIILTAARDGKGAPGDLVGNRASVDEPGGGHQTQVGARCVAKRRRNRPPQDRDG